MPFIRISDEYDDDGKMLNPIVEYAPPEAYRYQDFKEDFSKEEKAMLELLRSIGASELMVRYDGGSDEGFAHAESVRIHGEKKSLGDAVAALNTPEKVARLLAKPNPYLNKLTAELLLEETLEELAEAFAVRLLGSGYGTGEYELAGAFTANLATLEMVDDLNARPADWK